MYPIREQIKAARLDEDLITSHQLQFAKTLLAYLDLDRVLVFAVFTDQLQSHYWADRENMSHARRQRRLTLGDTVDFNIVRSHVSNGREFLCFGVLRCVDFDAVNPGAPAVQAAMEQVYIIALKIAAPTAMNGP